jgi:hypothetical protein
MNMISLTKNHQNEEVIKKMVANAFKPMEAIEIVELKEGYFNVAYLIKLNNGQEVILKIAPSKDASIMTYEKNLMMAEVESMRLVSEKTTVPVPEVLFYSAESTYNICDAQYFFMSKIEGFNYNSIKDTLTEHEQYQIEYEIGQHNRQMNEIAGKNFGYYASAKAG